MTKVRYVVLMLVTLLALALAGCAARNPNATEPGQGDDVMPPLAGEVEGEGGEAGMPEVEGEATAEPPAAVGQQSETITIDASGAISPASITTDPGTQLTLTLANLSSSAATVLIEGGYGATGTTLPAAIETGSAVTFSRQSLLLEFNEAGTYTLSCSSGCTGTVSLVVGGGAPMPEGEIVPPPGEELGPPAEPAPAEPAPAEPAPELIPTPHG